MSDSRLEKFIYAICSMDVTDLPVPLSRIEKLWNCLITGETPDFEPLSRNEKYLMAMLDRYDISNLPAPMSRGEKLLYKIAVGETDLSDVPGYLSRYEELLKYLIENGGIGFEYVLHTFNQSLYTLYATAEKPVKSAILKGCMLVNISIIKEYSFSSTQIQIKCYNNEMIKTNTEYTIIYDITDTNNLGSVMLDCFGNTPLPITLGRHKIKFTTLTSLKNNSNMYISGGFVGVVDNIMIIEGDYINVDIPYFTGMQSVKLPVLTTIGKNLFNVNSLKGLNNKFVVMNGEITMNNLYANALAKEARKAFNLLKPNKTYHYSCTVTNTGQSNTMVGGFNFGKTSADGATTYFSVYPNKPFKTPSDWENYTSVIIYGAMNNDGIVTVRDMQFEESSIATEYEPYKSNILTVNEEVELRGIGDVKDTLDCLTGELTQRIGEHIIDGNEHWATYGGYSVEGYKSFITTITGLNNLYTGTTAFISGDLKMESWNGYTKCTTEEMVWNHDPNAIGIKVKNETASNVEELKTFLASNPISFQYELATESIKTVDLTTVDQDGQPTKLKTYNDVTHVEIKADNLIPSVDIEVATKISETLATLDPQQLDISNTQNKLGQTIDEQTENTDAAMLATTEIYEQTL